VAISTDEHDNQAKFKASLKAPFAFIADADGAITRLYDVKVPLLTVAKRRTFVLAKGGNILRVDEGDAAIDPAGALAALQSVTP
jgi:peroxiredoxin